MWLECIGVVSGCCCKEVYRHPHNNYDVFPPTPLVLALFLAAATLHFKMFFHSCIYKYLPYSGKPLSVEFSSCRSGVSV